MRALGVHCNQRRETVATMDIHSKSNGAKAVSGINITTILLVIFQTPMQILYVAAIRILPVIGPEVVEVVDVSTLATQHFSEDAVLRHVERVEFIPVVAAVLENHAVEARLLREVDEFPALLKVHGRRHLDSRVLAIQKGALGNGEMVIPVGGHIHEVYIGTLAKLLVAFLATIDVCWRKSSLAEILLTSLSTSLFIITKGNNLSAWNVSETSYSTRSTHAQTDKANADCCHLRSRKSENILLSCRTSRCINNESSLVPMIFGAGAETLRDRINTEKNCRKKDGRELFDVHGFY